MEYRGRIDYINLRKEIEDRILESIKYSEIANEFSELDVGKVPSTTLIQALRTEIANITANGIQLGGTAINVESLPDATENKGQLYIVDGKAYISDGNVWIDNGGIQGERGEQGEKGDKVTLEDFTQEELDSIRGEKGETGDRGPQGDKGIQGDKGEIGATGIQGIQGIQGETGERGEQGEKGETGLTGAVGLTGERGEQGPKGDKGDQGIQGITGIQGIQGEKGDGSVIRFTYDSVAELFADASNPLLVVGDLLLITSGIDDPDNGKVYIVQTDGIEFLSQLTGVKGDKGDTGAQGPQGEQGEHGADGIQGVHGERGEPGLQGEKGEKGDTGLTGATGAMGIQGVQGLQGVKGDKGDTGDAFTFEQFTAEQLLNLRGERGEKGDRGERGLQGIQGIPGQQGLDGPQGVRGLQGVQGQQGLTGAKGDPFVYANFTTTQLAGLKGAKGDQGPQGLVGQQGIQGIPGQQGIRGATGAQGVPGEVSLVQLQTHENRNATTTTKGHMQVGSGLLITNGVVSLDKNALTPTANISPSADISAYPTGLSVQRVILNPDDAQNAEYYRLMNILLETSFPITANSLRMYVTTVVEGGYGQQTVEIIQHLESGYLKIFELSRVYQGEWRAWFIRSIENQYRGNPEGTHFSFYGAKVRDIRTGILYIKKGLKTQSSNTGWEAENAVINTAIEANKAAIATNTAANAITTATVTRGNNFSGTFSANVHKQGMFTRLDLNFVNPNGVTVNAGTEVIIGVIPSGFRPPVRESKFYVGDNTGNRTPRHAIIVYTNGNIGWTPSVNAGYWTMSGSVVY